MRCASMADKHIHTRLSDWAFADLAFIQQVEHFRTMRQALEFVIRQAAREVAARDLKK